MKKTIFFLSIACLSLGVTLAEAQEETKEEWSAPVQVGIATVTEEMDSVELTQPGVVVSRSSAKIIPQVEGEIQKLCFKPGSVIAKGDVLFTLDPIPYQAALMVAKARLADCQAQMDLAQISYKRKKSLMEKSVISQEEYDHAVAGLNSSKAQFLEAQGNLLKAQHDFDHTTIKAPIDGLIGFYTASVGNYVTKESEPLCTIVQWQPILVRFPIAVTDLWTLFDDYNDTVKNSIVRIQLGDNEMHSENSHVEFVGNEVNSNSDTLMLYASFPNKDLELLPGANVVAYLTRKEGTKKTAVPVSAILYDNEGSYVYRVVPDTHKVEQVRVDTGNVLGGDIQIVESQKLKAGDLVVSNGTHKVMPGTTVKMPGPPPEMKKTADPEEKASAQKEK